MLGMATPHRRPLQRRVVADDNDILTTQLYDDYFIINPKHAFSAIDMVKCWQKSTISQTLFVLHDLRLSLFFYSSTKVLADIPEFWVISPTFLQHNFSTTAGIIILRALLQRSLKTIILCSHLRAMKLAKRCRRACYGKSRAILT